MDQDWLSMAEKIPLVSVWEQIVLQEQRLHSWPVMTLVLMSKDDLSAMLRNYLMRHLVEIQNDLNQIHREMPLDVIIHLEGRNPKNLV